MAPTIANARAYASMLVRASATSTIDKQRICDQWGWDLKAIGEEPAIVYEAYQRRRCELLFGEGISPYLQEHFEALNNDEVARAHANFINRSQIAIRLPQPSLNELADALQRAVSTKT